MVKAQVKGFSGMQSEHNWFSPASDGTWPSVAKSSLNPLPSGTLKRSHSVSNTMDTLPLAPKLRGEIILEVFTHKSLRFPGAPINEDSDYGDNERLAILGQKVLETAITFTFFSKRPMISAEAITQRRDEMLSDANVESWIVGYKLREKVRCSPDAVASLTNSEEGRLLFSSFVGAVYVQNGMETVQDWIGKLVDPEYESPADEYSAYKRFKSENMGSPTPPPPPPMQQPPMPQPPPPMGPPPPLPVNNPLAPAQPSAAFLPLFNQTANQRRLAVEYPAQFSGPAHAGRWTVQCVVNGIEKGTGTGASKQLAKEEAARQAYYAMGWAPRG